jgi:hypothetical protein
MSATNPSKRPTSAPGTLDLNTWKPPHVEPVQHDDPKVPVPSVKEDLPGAQPGGRPSTP